MSSVRGTERPSGAFDARVRAAALKLRRQAGRDVERLRSSGWTQADFAQSLRDTLGSGEDPPDEEDPGAPVLDSFDG